MALEHWSQVQALFLEAEALPEDARAEFLDGACCGDAALRTEVETLLRGAQETFGVFERHDPALPGETASQALAAGTRLGPWSIEQLVGRGGMGEVYEARRADGAFELRVAIKLLKRGLDTDAVVARFTRERRLLAQLDHPNIAHVLDAGVTEDGRPFLAMEYVAGKPITEYARTQELPTAAILRLMITVCEAVQAAHAKRIVHRDLKPSNVLVSAKGQVKLLDFGIAKALAEEDADATRMAGEAMALTPAYAAPEQLLSQATTPASDVYALGVILYQLLAERLPHQRAGRSTREIALGLDRETIDRPSTVLRRERGRLPEPQRIERLQAVSKDLDLIVLKALHTEAGRRYASAEALADDLHRLLEERPVLARPDSLVYRVGRFVRRNRRVMSQVAGATAMVALIAGGVLALQARRHAQEAFERHIANLIALGQKELQNKQPARAATYLSAAYAAGETSADVRYLLARTLPSVEALSARVYAATGTPSPALAYSPDGRQVLAAVRGPDGGNKLQLWERDTGKLLWSVDTSVRAVQFQFSREGGRVLLLGGNAASSKLQESALAVYDLRSGQQLFHSAHRSGLQGVVQRNDPAGFAAGDPSLNRVAIFESEHEAAIWDVRMDRALLRLPVPQGLVSVVFSPDGTSVLTGAGDGDITLWDAATGAPRLRIAAKPRIATAAFFAAGNRIASLSRTGTINLWDGDSGEWLGAVGSQAGTLSSIDLSGDRSMLSTEGARGKGSYWNLASGHIAFEQVVGGGSFCVDPQGAWLLGVGEPPVLVSMRTGEESAWLDGHTGHVFAVACHADGRHFLTAGADGLIREWDVSAMNPYPRQLLSLPEDAAAAARELRWANFTAKGQMFTGGLDGVLRFWDVARGQLLSSFGTHQGRIARLFVSRDRQRAIASSADNSASVWNLTNAAPISILKGGHESVVFYAALSDAGIAVTSADHDPTAVLWQVDSGRMLARLHGHKAPILWVGFSPNGSRVLTAGADGTARIWDASSGRALLTLAGHAAEVHWAGYTPDGTQVLTTSQDGTARLWDAGSGRLLRTLDEGKGGSPMTRAAITGDSRLAAITADDGAIRLWDLWQGGVRHLDRLASGRHLDVSFSPDESLVVAGNNNATVVGLWSVSSGRLLWQSHLEGGAMVTAFDSSGGLLTATGPLSTQVPVWDVSLETRDAATIAAIIDCKSPWVLQEESLASRAPHPERCAKPGQERGIKQSATLRTP